MSDSQEEKVINIAKELFDRSINEVPSFFNTNKWKGKIFNWAMLDKDFRIQLLRFIDVLPALKDDSEIIKVLNEYFSDDKIHLPAPLKWGLNRLSKTALIPSIAGKIVKSQVKALARQFIVGADPDDALKYIQSLLKNGFAFSVDLLGEAVVSDYEAQIYIDRYFDILNKIDDNVFSEYNNPVIESDHFGNIPKTNISLKVSSFFSQLDPKARDFSIKMAKDALRPILKKAVSQKAALTFDMEHYYIKNITIDIFKSLIDEDEFKDYPYFGIALQAYLKDNEEDILDILQWVKNRKTPISIRLVKGAYWDYESMTAKQKSWPIPVHEAKSHTDFHYERQSRILLENIHLIRPQFATHNLRSISNVLAIAEELKINSQAIEFQLLYGMAEPLRNALKDKGCRVRIYSPVGELVPGMAYFVRRILENTSNESVLRKSFAEKISFEELSAKPSLEEIEENRELRYFENQAAIDFSQIENQNKMKAALEKVKQSFGRSYPLLINNKKHETKDTIQSFNPAYKDQLIGSVSKGTKELLEKAIQFSDEAYNKWKHVPAEKRAEYLFRCADLMKERRFDLMALEVYEVGKTWEEADGDVNEAIDHLNYYAKEMLRLSSTIDLEVYPGEANRYIYEGRGIAMVISPWNFPLAITTGMLCAAMVTANTVILKPSSLSPILAYKVVEMFYELGLPKGVLQYFPCSGSDLGNDLVSHPKIDLIAFTGSKEVGLDIIERAAKYQPGQRNVKKVIAEMGGKNATIIDSSADLDEAVLAIIHSAFGYQGQKCSACSRVIVLESVYDIFIQRFKEALSSLSINDPVQAETQVGPVIDKNAYNKILSYIELAKKEADVFTIDALSDGYYISPTLVTNISTDSKLWNEEIFGPVVSVIKVKSIDDAIEIANVNEYALTGGIYSRTPSSIEKVRNNLNAGNIYINRKITGALVARQPFGGYKMSGIGSKAGGPDYLIQFMNPKSISENTMRRGFAPE